jgi:hypothetical protein
MVVVEIFDEFRRLQSNLADVTMQCRLVVTRAKSQGTPISLDSSPVSTKNKPATRTISTKINDKMAGIIYNPQ